MKTNNTSPVCSCITCHKEYSVKGIFSHFFASHNEDGIKVMNDIRKKGTDSSFRNVEFQKNIHKPAKLPVLMHCSNLLCTNTTISKFCSKSCSAITNNLLRTSESREKQKSTLILNRAISGKPFKGPRIRAGRLIKFRTCIICNNIDSTTGHFQSDKCSFCNDSLTYRTSCTFKFNLKDFPDEFNLSLLTTLGMFNPKTNQKGVSRDHLLSVSYGKQHRIDPAILSHPANCQLITQSANKAKQHHSSITYEELLSRITIWDLKYKK